MRRSFAPVITILASVLLFFSFTLVTPAHAIDPAHARMSFHKRAPQRADPAPPSNSSTASAPASTTSTTTQSTTTTATTTTTSSSSSRSSSSSSSSSSSQSQTRQQTPSSSSSSSSTSSKPTAETETTSSTTTVSTSSTQSQTPTTSPPTKALTPTGLSSQTTFFVTTPTGSASSSTIDAAGATTTPQSAATKGFFGNKAAVGVVFTIVSLIGVGLIIFLASFIMRKRNLRKRAASNIFWDKYDPSMHYRASQATNLDMRPASTAAAIQAYPDRESAYAVDTGGAGVGAHGGQRDYAPDDGYNTAGGSTAHHEHDGSNHHADYMAQGDEHAYDPYAQAGGEVPVHDYLGYPPGTAYADPGPDVAQASSAGYAGYGQYSGPQHVSGQHANSYSYAAEPRLQVPHGGAAYEHSIDSFYGGRDSQAI